MLSRHLTSLLADMAYPEASDILRIHRVIGCIGAHGWRVIGGGYVPLPGEGSLAPRGMRFRDARPECRRHRLEALASRSRLVSYEELSGL